MSFAKRNIGRSKFWLLMVVFMLNSLSIGKGRSFYLYKDSNVPNHVLSFVDIDLCHLNNSSFKIGEQLVYKIYYNWGFIWMPAGEVEFKVMEEGENYHFQIVGKTYDSYNWFFEVEDYFDSWVNKKDLLPTRFTKSIKEGKYRVYDDLTFKQSENKIYNERGKAKNDIRERHNFEVNNCMHDMVSILYYCRNLNFSKSKKGDKFPIHIFADKEVWPLSVTYKGREPNKKIKDNGHFNTLQFSPKVIEGDLFPDGAQVNVWVTDDKNKMPLLIESPLSVGSAKAVLKEYKGLRYPIK